MRAGPKLNVSLVIIIEHLRGYDQDHTSRAGLRLEKEGGGWSRKGTGRMRGGVGWGQGACARNGCSPGEERRIMHLTLQTEADTHCGLH